MDFLYIHFPVSGVEIPLFIPPAVAFVISFFTSMAGISGAFLILPFQVSVLGFTAPSVSATNFLYNVVGTPGGVWRYARERRLVWPLAGSIIAGTLQGVDAGHEFRDCHPVALQRRRVVAALVGVGAPGSGGDVRGQ